MNFSNHLNKSKLLRFKCHHQRNVWFTFFLIGIMEYSQISDTCVFLPKFLGKGLSKISDWVEPLFYTHPLSSFD